MAITKLTFDEALNSAKNDAFFNYYLTNKQNGIFRDLGGACTPSTSGGKITFKDGFVSIYGRRVYIENNTSIIVPLIAERKGYVILKIDTRNDEAGIELKEGTSTSFPSLTQEDLLLNDGIYEFPLVGYLKTASSLSLITNVTSYIDTNETQLLTNVNALNNKIGLNDKAVRELIDSKQHGLRTSSVYLSARGNKYSKFDLSSFSDKSSYIIYFSVMDNVVSAPIYMIRRRTTLSFKYLYSGTQYQGFLEMSGNTLTIQVGVSGYEVTYVYIVY